MIMRFERIMAATVATIAAAIVPRTWVLADQSALPTLAPVTVTAETIQMTGLDPANPYNIPPPRTVRAATIQMTGYEPQWEAMPATPSSGETPFASAPPDDERVGKDTYRTQKFGPIEIWAPPKLYTFESLEQEDEYSIVYLNRCDDKAAITVLGFPYVDHPMSEILAVLCQWLEMRGMTAEPQVQAVLGGS